MEIEKLDRALTIRGKIEQLEELKASLLEHIPLRKALGNQFRGTPEVLPDENVFDDVESAMDKFNTAWINHIDSMLDSLRTEFDAL